jgi:imidazoleglycerol phosphate synthase cyclase subunit
MRPRVAARLDVKNETVIKGFQLEGLRVVGSVKELATRYYEQGADELLIIDSVASLYGREAVLQSIKAATREVFIPVTAGGGIRSLDDAAAFFDAGADRVALNSRALANPQIVSDIASVYGSQAVVLSIESKKVAESQWFCFYECGRENSGVLVKDWVQRALNLGAGELLVTSVDSDGTLGGPDKELIHLLDEYSSLPVVYSGGIRGASDLGLVFMGPKLSCVAVGTALHRGNVTISDLKLGMKDLALKPKVSS